MMNSRTSLSLSDSDIRNYIFDIETRNHGTDTVDHGRK